MADSLIKMSRIHFGSTKSRHNYHVIDVQIAWSFSIIKNIMLLHNTARFPTNETFVY